MNEPLHATVLDGDCGIGLEIVTSPANGNAQLRWVIGRKANFSGPITVDALLEASRVLGQAARNIE